MRKLILLVLVAFPLSVFAQKFSVISNKNKEVLKLTRKLNMGFDEARGLIQLKALNIDVIISSENSFIYRYTTKFFNLPVTRVGSNYGSAYNCKMTFEGQVFTMGKDVYNTVEFKEISFDAQNNIFGNSNKDVHFYYGEAGNQKFNKAIADVATNYYLKIADTINSILGIKEEQLTEPKIKKE